MQNIMNTPHSDAALARLLGFAREAAESIRPRIARMDLEGYRCFLDAMYHYTRHTGDKALLASRNCPAGDLRTFFEYMRREEQGHYRLAEADLRALGYAVHPDEPASVAAFGRYWASIRPEEHAAYLGALVVFENVAQHLSPDIAALLYRLRLPNTQSRWLREHAVADLEHGRQALAIAARYVAIDADSLLAGAERACQLWQAIFRSALEDRRALQRLPNEA